MAKIIFWLGHIVLLGYGAYMYFTEIAPEEASFTAQQKNTVYYHPEPFFQHLDMLRDGNAFQSTFFIWVIWLVAHLVVSAVSRNNKKNRYFDQ